MTTHIYSLTNNQATLGWNANTESDLAGYRVHYGTSSGVYTTTVDVGNVTQATITGTFLSNNTYYFALTAYNTSGQESGYSNEVSEVPYFTIQMGGAATASIHATHVYASSGGMVIGTNTALHSRRRVPAPTGGMIMSGTSVSSLKGGGRFTYSSSGGMIMGQNVAAHSHRVVVPAATSGMVMGGASAYKLSSVRSIFSYTGQGGMVMGGIPLHSRVHAPVPADGMVMSGAGVYHFFPAIISKSYAYIPSGGMVMGTNTAPHSTRHVPVPAGGMVMGGASVYHFAPAAAAINYPYLSTGGINMGGAAPHSHAHASSSAGGMSMGGHSASSFISNAPAPKVYIYQPVGGMTFSGASAHQRSIIRSSSGGMTMGGTATAFIRTFSTGSAIYTAPDPDGGMVFEGTAGLVIIKIAEFEGGGIVMGGSSEVSTSLDQFQNNKRFRIFKRDCEVRIKEWGTNAQYTNVNPFGGPHHEEPSGAEI